MASNVQRGPRRMDAGDWVRMKRLTGSNNYILDQPRDITNPSSGVRLEPESGRRVYTEFGTSKTRRPASFFTDYVASQSADYVLELGGPGNKTLISTSVCDCSVTDPVKHNGVCIKCKYKKNSSV